MAKDNVDFMAGSRGWRESNTARSGRYFAVYTLVALPANPSHAGAAIPIAPLATPIYDRGIMDTLIITGGAGFIGSCLVRHLVAAGEVHVVNLDLLTYAGSRASIAQVAGSPRYTFVQGDIADSDLVADLLAKYQPTAIINLAAESHVDRSIDGPRRFVETNIVGTFTLLDETRKYWTQLSATRRDAFRFVQVSSDEVFGSLSAEGVFDEQSPYAPNSPYAASKASADHWMRAYHHTYGLPTIVTTSTNNYGPFQFPEKLVPLITLRALDRKPLPVYGDGQQVRDWLHVDDHATALRLVLAHGRPGEIYCIGGECERTNVEVVETICGVVDRLQPGRTSSARDLIEFVTDRPGHDRRYAIDATKLKTQLGWMPSIEFATGIEQTVRWYAEHRAWADEVMRGVYAGERLGLGDIPAADRRSGDCH